MTIAVIDLGGTGLRVGYLGPDGFVLVPTADETGAAPAAVWLAGPGDARAGELAADGPPDEVITAVRADLLTDPRATARERYFHGRFESPVAVAGYLLEDAARRAGLAAGSNTTDVILGRPATIDDTVPLRRAAAAARLTVKGITAEPVAVALHYGAVGDGVDHAAVVADIGGTAIDVTVLRINGRVVTIAAAARQPLRRAAELPDQVAELVRAMIEEAGDGAGQPDTVLLAGGASQQPTLGEALADRLGLHVRMSQPELAVIRGLALSADFGPLYVTGLGGETLTPPPPPKATLPADPLPRPADPLPANGAAGAPATDPLPRPEDTEKHETVPDDPSRTAPGMSGSQRTAVPPPAPPPPPRPARTTASGAGGPPRAPGDVPVGGTPDGGQLAGRPVDRLRALRRGERLLLTWDWPDGSAEAQVRWRSETDGPGHHGSARCSRRLFFHEGGFEIPVGREGVMVTVEALGYGPEFDGAPPSAVRVEPTLPVVLYDPDVRGWRKWTATVTFISQIDCQLPPIIAVLGTGGYKPESTKDGEVVQVIPAQPLSTAQPTVVTFELTPRHGTCWLVCLPADDDTVPQVDLRPAALHRLKVRR